MPIQQDVKALLKNKPFLIGAAAVGGVGLIVFLRRDDDGATGEDDAAGGTVGTAYPGQFDTTGTDIAGWLSDYSSGLSDELSGFLDQMKAGQDAQNEALQDQFKDNSDVLAASLASWTEALKKIQAPKTSSSSSKKTTTKKISSSSSSSKKYVTVKKFTSSNPPWQSTLSGIASHYGTSVSRLLSLNPSIKNRDLIHPGQKIRYK